MMSRPEQRIAAVTTFVDAVCRIGLMVPLKKMVDSDTSAIVALVEPERLRKTTVVKLSGAKGNLSRCELY